jgi:hypothetical protein
VKMSNVMTEKYKKEIILGELTFYEIQS